MFQNNTVFVVGAGASSEVGFPVGDKLRDEIASSVRFRLDQWGHVQSGRESEALFHSILRIPSLGKNRDRIATAASKIAGGIGFTASVDTFLEIHASDQDIQACAKAAICKIIADHERKSPLHVDQSNLYNVMDTSGLKDTWLQELSPLLFEKIDPERLKDAFAPVKFVAFNYDRCIEWYVFNALKGLYFLDANQAAEVAQHLIVHHPYGTIGKEAWLSLSGGVAFGADISDRMAHVYSLIRTFTEQAEKDAIEKIRDVIRQAHTLVFLGFSFGPQNIDFLREERDGTPCSVKRILGTTYGMSPSDKTTVEGQLKSRFAALDVELADLKSAEFMRRYRRSLSA